MSSKRPAHRPTRIYPEAERRLLRPDVAECPHCGGELRNTGTLYLHKYIQTLEGPVEVRAYGWRCANPVCPRPEARYHAQASALRLSLPFGTYGVDVLAFIGWQRDDEQRSLVEIQRQLTARGIEISERHVGRLYRDSLSLVGGLTVEIQARLAATVQTHGGLIWAVDGLQPEADAPLFYVLYEVRSQTAVAGIWLEQRDRDHLAAWLAPFGALGFPVNATLSDGEGALVGALKQVWPEAPHQLCQMHCLKAWAQPLVEADRHLRQALRSVLAESLPEVVAEADRLPAARTPDLAALQADEPPAALNPGPPPEALGAVARSQPRLAQLHLAIWDCLRRPGRSPLLFGGLRGDEQLEQIVRTLARLLPPQSETPLHPYRRAGQRALAQTQPLAASGRTTQQRLQQVAHLLAHPFDLLPAETPTAQVAPRRRAHRHGVLLDWCAPTAAQAPLDRTFALKGLDVLTDWGPDRLHCDRIPDLPPSNTALEALCGDWRRHQRRLSGRKETAPLQRHAHLLIWRLATSCEHLCQLLRSVSDEARQTARRFVLAAEARARWLLSMRRQPANATATLVAEYLDLLSHPKEVPLPLAA
ncbi:MAG: transposase [Ardenticatenaceae bacterium]|nr:transposase [Ardenticatenaceae bacterium]